MNERMILEELVELLEANGVLIRYEPLAGGGGGLCVVKGERIFFVDTQAASIETARMAAEAVAEVVDTEAIYIRPEIREFIEKTICPDGKNGFDN